MCTRLVIAIMLAFCGDSAFGQDGPISFHARAFIAQYYCTNQGAQNDPAGVYFFTPSLGANWDLVARYRPDSSRFFVETGLSIWLWNYRAALNTRNTGTQYHGFRAGRAGASVGIPLRVGFCPANGFSLSAGAIVLRNMSSGTSGYHFTSRINEETLEGDAYSEGRTYTSLAFDLTAGFQLSPRFDILLRGGLDTERYPTVHIEHRVTRNGLSRQYAFDGSPKLAFVAVGAGFHF